MSKKIKFPVVILKLSDEDGNEDILAFRTDEEAENYLYNYVSENWDDVFDDEDNTVPEDKEEAIAEYYGQSSDNYDIYHRLLEYSLIDVMDIVNQQRELEQEAAAPVPEMGGLKTHGGF